jgi:RNA polymerase subunit RPABC4/transcription elongation factor Spt4
MSEENKEELEENLEQCRNCYYKVKSGIRRCPYCGILNPTLKQKDIWITMFVILCVMGIYTYIIK